MDMDSLPLDHVDILLKNLPNDDEKKKFENYIKDKKSPELLQPADKFLYEVYRGEGEKGGGRRGRGGGVGEGREESERRERETMF